MNAQQFQNAIRIMYSLDEVAQVLPPEKIAAFHANPADAIIRMDAPTFDKVFDLIEKRQSGSTSAQKKEAAQCLYDDLKQAISSRGFEGEYTIDDFEDEKQILGLT